MYLYIHLKIYFGNKYLSIYLCYPITFLALFMTFPIMTPMLRKTYLGIRVIKCAIKRILKCLNTCSMRENAYGIGFCARWVNSALVSDSSPRLSGSGWIQTLVLR